MVVERATLIYDGECGLCRQTVGLVANDGIGNAG
jgi:predicted DCC family thiol-disulfide oxidoreductase YuxK